MPPVVVALGKAVSSSAASCPNPDRQTLERRMVGPSASLGCCAAIAIRLFSSTSVLPSLKASCRCATSVAVGIVSAPWRGERGRRLLRDASHPKDDSPRFLHRPVILHARYASA